MGKQLRIAVVILLALAIILSCTVFGNKFTDPATYSHTIEVLDQNRTRVLGLSAASTIASAAISTLKDDICSSVADELSELSSWFMMILGFTCLEKYLLTILGAVACYILIPLGCSALLVNCFFPAGLFKTVGIRFIAAGLAMLLVIPSSIWVSDQINATYSKSIEMTIQSASAVSDNLVGGVNGDNNGGSAVIDEAKNILDDISNSVTNVIEQFKNLLNRFVEATAVMLVTTCLIPIFVVLFYIWFIKTVFNIPIVVPTNLLHPKRPRHFRKEEDEDEKEDEALLVD